MKKIWGTTLYLGETTIDTKYGIFITKVYQNIINHRYILALIYHQTNLQQKELNLYTRIHSSCVTSEMLNSQDCDCVEQLNGALKIISEQKKGILFYLIQEGRGCGYIGKARGCQMVQHSEIHHHHHTLTTFDVYHQLGMKSDYREYYNIKEIMQMLNIYHSAKFTLLTNNPDKINGLKNLGIQIKKTQELEFIPNPFNQLYLKSKTEYGHLLNKTDIPEKKFNFPYETIPPFEPYHLPNKKRFIYCASYYIPIRPYKNRYILSSEDIETLNITVKHPENIYTLLDNVDKKYKQQNPYWFQVHLYFDVSSNLDYIMLEYKNPYKKEIENRPLVRFHSESLLDRFPLTETLYQDRYKKSILQIVENGYGFLLLFYRDGRGSGLGYYLLNQKHLNQKIGIKRDSRDYYAAVQLLQHHIKEKEIDMLYSNFSKYNIQQVFNKYQIKVRNWINIDDNDKKGVLSICNRVFQTPILLRKNKNHNKLTFDSNNKYIITGIGSSKSHAYYFIYLAQKYYNIDILFQPLISFSNIDHVDKTLIVISQGLSYNTHPIIKKWNFRNIILLSGKSIQTNSCPQKINILQQLHSNNCKTFFFDDDNPDDTLVRITGPVSGLYFIYNLIVPEQLQYSLQLDEIVNYQKVFTPEITNYIIQQRKTINLYIICNNPEIEFVKDIANRIMEVLFCHNPCVKSYFEFAHGTYQSSLYLENNFYICIEDQLTDNFIQLFEPELLQNRLIILKSSNNIPELKIIDYQLTINYWIEELVQHTGFNYKQWKGKNKQAIIYNIQE